ncbi:PcfJ domain-containing protein [Peptostreptococcus sp. D1]|uniref:PcfJ domain-containing protein n=1 Tax=Peptostreptococcus sp. D1 TaxID=72304 RepID=UPI0008EBFB2F|nr:PcfJ domain-containing protein [Peptostreptococcus sp. D1]SFE89800.1 PcfJ-like protein [Peptostreptococcus sp. D1]
MISKKLIKANINCEPIKPLNVDINIRYIVKSCVKKIDEKEILFIYFYNNCFPKIVVVFDGAEYITAKINSSNQIKWYTGKIFSVMDIYVYYHSKAKTPLYADNDSIETINRYLGLHSEDIISCYTNIEVFQEKQLRKKLEEKHRIDKERIDNKMSKVKPIPNYFQKFVEFKYFDKRYMFYEYSKKKYNTCSCSNCRQHVEILSSEIKNNKDYVCPNCKSAVVFIPRKKKQSIMESGRVSFYQKTKDNDIVLREFSATKITNAITNTSKLELYENFRNIYKESNVELYTYGNYKNTGKFRWCEYDGSSFTSASLYKDNIAREIKGTRYQYSALDKYFKHTNNYYHGSEFENYNNCKEIEFFNKTGLYGLTYGVTHLKINENEKNIFKWLQISKYDFNLLRNIDSNLQAEYLKLFQMLRKINYSIDKSILERVFKIYSKMDRDVFSLLISNGNIHKSINYLLKIDFEDLQYYNDYIEMCIKEDIDLTNRNNLYVKNIIDEHDKMVDLVNKRKYEKYNPIIREIYSGYNEKLFENDDLVVIKPNTAVEILREGKSLNHCVANYIDKVANGKTLIFFLRKKENVKRSYYTIEFKNNKVVQCRGFNNKNTTTEIELFIKEFEKEYSKTLSNVS